MIKTLGTHNYYVYILTNKNKTVLYIGVTNDLKLRIYQHSNPSPYSSSFTSKYKCYYLVYYEHFFEIEEAIFREKELKGFSRAKKNIIIESFNPNWKFLNDTLGD